MKSRLKKIALMSPDVFEKQLDQISDKGRDVLKVIEDYKFFIEQVSRVMQNDPGVSQMIENKKKNLDQASQAIYDVVFEIENMDITTSYYNQQKATELSKGPEVKTNTLPIGNPTPAPGGQMNPAAPAAPTPPQNPGGPATPLPPPAGGPKPPVGPPGQKDDSTKDDSKKDDSKKEEPSDKEDKGKGDSSNNE